MYGFSRVKNCPVIAVKKLASFFSSSSLLAIAAYSSNFFHNFYNGLGTFVSNIKILA